MTKQRKEFSEIRKQEQMPTAYSLALREKVMQAIDKGMSVTTASRTFDVSRNSIYLWRKRLQKQGTLEATTGYHNPNELSVNMPMLVLNGIVR